MIAKKVMKVGGSCIANTGRIRITTVKLVDMWKRRTRVLVEDTSFDLDVNQSIEKIAKCAGMF